MARQDKIKSIPSTDRNDGIAKLKKIWENMNIIMEDIHNVRTRIFNMSANILQSFKGLYWRL
jgi:hypothetical protein